MISKMLIIDQFSYPFASNDELNNERTVIHDNIFICDYFQ